MSDDPFEPDDFEDERDYVQEMKDELPPREEPDEPPTEAEYHGAQYDSRVRSTDLLLMKAGDASDDEGRSGLLAEAQVFATLADAAATMRAAAVAEESAHRIAEAALPHMWLLRSGEEEQLLGIYRTRALAMAAGRRYWSGENPGSAASQFTWHLTSTGFELAAFELHAAERGTGITVGDVGYGDRFGYSDESPF